MSTVLQALVSVLATGDVRVIDLTHTLTPAFPSLVLPPEYGQVSGFELETISRYDDRGRTGTGTTSAAASTRARTSTHRPTG